MAINGNRIGWPPSASISSLRWVACPAGRVMAMPQPLSGFSGMVKRALMIGKRRQDTVGAAMDKLLRQCLPQRFGVADSTMHLVAQDFAAVDAGDKAGHVDFVAVAFRISAQRYLATASQRPAHAAFGLDAAGTVGVVEGRQDRQ